MCPVSGAPICWPVSAFQQPHRLVGAGRCQPVPVGAERHIVYSIGVPDEDLVDGPHAYGHVEAPGDQASTVGAERDAEDPPVCPVSGAPI